MKGVESMNSIKKILIISTGGTISQVHTENGIAISNERSFKSDTFSNSLSNLDRKSVV